jgi:hypothetical protein
MFLKYHYVAGINTCLLNLINYKWVVKLVIVFIFFQDAPDQMLCIYFNGHPVLMVPIIFESHFTSNYSNYTIGFLTILCDGFQCTDGNIPVQPGFGQEVVL